MLESGRNDVLTGSTSHSSRSEMIADVLLLRISGEIDFAGAPAFDHVLIESIRREKHIVLDLCSVTYIDSTSLAVLVAAQRQSSAAGNTFLVVSKNGHLARLFALTGFDKVLPIYQSIAEATAAINSSAA